MGSKLLCGLVGSLWALADKKRKNGALYSFIRYSLTQSVMFYSWGVAFPVLFRTICHCFFLRGFKKKRGHPKVGLGFLPVNHGGHLKWVGISFSSSILFFTSTA
ncbi:hypothetical protein B0T20DRAFT_413391 [Sordaria brevicollis]|uniref:Uncharacterized protein n=1 Tax=Sordaria brevicollis TaxID=83679 RepID=A0AAE0PDE7_SORBR|nr:hypothetical protein B0T20DRAFT_413391 [Sordaria brevicollis]